MATIRIQRADGKTVDDIAWQAEELEIVERPNGPAAAALLAAGIGLLVLGLLTVLAEQSTGIKDWLQFKDRVGPLSGKTTMAVVAYIVSWAALTPLLWRRNVDLSLVLIGSAVLVAAGFLGTFPKFFQLFPI
jgi:hypothetical protein